MNIQELEDKIVYYSTKYYMGEPEITDAEFDGLVDMLRRVCPTSPVLKTGWGFEVVGDKVKHKYAHIGSLDKTKSYMDIPERFKNKTIYISPKLDGLSAVAYYQNGKLVRGVTRGNGEYGKDITMKLKVILGERILDSSFTGAVRGELIIGEDYWKLLNNKYNNLISPRNFAAGVINRKEIDEDLVYIDMVVYKIVGQEGGRILSQRDEILHWLSINFKKSIPEYYYPILNEQSWHAFHKQTFDDFKKLGYGLDGLVLTNGNVVYNNQTMGYIYDECAYKFDAESTTTFVKSIEWELSRTQRLVPVAIIEPVELSGAIINRATCNNAKMVKDWGLGAGAEIQIQRANEVIPHIISVIQESTETLPCSCPACGNDLIWDGVDLKCANELCPNINASDLQKWCEIIGETDGLQYTIMSQYLQVYGITSLKELYSKKDIILNDLENKQLSITELKIKEFFEKLFIKPVPIDKALLALNIPRLGEKTVNLLAPHKQLILDILIFSYNKMCGNNADISIFEQKLFELVKDATTQSIIKNYAKFFNLYYLFSSDCSQTRISFLDKLSHSDIKYIAVTGALNTMKRNAFEQYIKQYGYELSSNLKKCLCLVNNDVNSNSTKNKQAKELGIPIVSELDFLNSLDI